MRYLLLLLFFIPQCKQKSYIPYLPPNELRVMYDAKPMSNWEKKNYPIKEAQYHLYVQGDTVLIIDCTGKMGKCPTDSVALFIKDNP